MTITLLLPININVHWNISRGWNTSKDNTSIRDDKKNLNKLLGHCLCWKLNETRMLWMLSQKLPSNYFKKKWNFYICNWQCPLDTIRNIYNDLIIYSQHRTHFYSTFKTCLPNNWKLELVSKWSYKFNHVLVMLNLIQLMKKLKISFLSSRQQSLLLCIIPSI